MHFPASSLTLATALLTSLISAQTVHVVSVGMNKTLAFAPNTITAAAGDMVQFQFLSGNHTVTQSTFDNPCQPVGDFSMNTTGFHSGFNFVVAGSPQLPTFTVLVNNTKPIWAYCAQSKHCQAGMSLVINENTEANVTKSLANYQAASKGASTVVPGVAASMGGTSGSNTTTTAGSGTSESGSGSGSGSGTNSTTPVSTSFGTAFAAPGLFSILSLFITAAVLL